MSEMPTGWATASIDHLFAPLEDGRLLHQGWSPQCEKEPSPDESMWGVLRTTSIQDGRFADEHNKRLPDKLAPRPILEVKTGDLLITCAGPRSRCGVACLVRNTRKRLMISGKMYRFRVCQKNMEPRYVEAYLRTPAAQAAIDKMKTGGSDSGLNLTHDRFKQLQLPIAPFQEQRRIADEIEKQFTRLDDAVAALKRVQANLKRYRASVLKAACEGRLVPTEAELARKEKRDYEPASELLKRILAERRAKWEADQLQKMIAGGKPPKDDLWRNKYREPPSASTSNLPELPEGWVWATVEQLSTKVVDGVHKKPDYVPSGIPFVTVKNLTAGPGISFDELNYITPSDHEEFVKRANPEPGDILVSKDGTLGVIRAIRTEQIFNIFVSVAMIKPVLRELTNYFELALLSPQVQIQMVPKGSGLQHIHLEDLREDCVPLPPLTEHQRIVAAASRQMSIIDSLEKELETRLLQSAALRQSILHSAFSGKLVPQDPNDEPASVLLERIRAERARVQEQKQKAPKASNGASPVNGQRRRRVKKLAQGVSPGKG